MTLKKQIASTMKKKIFYGIAVLAIAALAAFNLNLNNSTTGKLSDVSLANVELLAQAEVLGGLVCRLDASYSYCYPGGSSWMCYCGL
jgi:heme A synthase